ncbi:unnamed protein product [Spirodela intermedia]|uniref:DUF7032 domain-containing protein n=1 Tax=Spirodela intermedia TaxID=51605 RepID=A0A7I8JAV1_SPIIN|nr:unnamed protein product [Spirodela intermedia]CAA6666865.1 unnamed protein product [Spirodela intermedia]
MTIYPPSFSPRDCGHLGGVSRPDGELAPHHRRHRHATAAAAAEALPAEHWLSQANRLLPIALERTRATKGFTGRWRTILSMLERLPPCLSRLSTHPCFSKNVLCREQLQSVCKTLTELIELASSGNPPAIGKLQMQSDLDSLACKLDMSLRDCGLLIKTEVLGEVTLPPPEPEAAVAPGQPGARELLARLQIGHAEAKQRALDGLLETMKEDQMSVISVLSRRGISALVQFLAATSPKVREKAATAICSLAESVSCENLLLSEGALPPLIRLAETGTRVSKEKAVLSLQRLSMSADAARAIAAAAGAGGGSAEEPSAIPEIRQNLADEGTITMMIDLLDGAYHASGSKEHAAECLQNLTAGNDSLRRAVVSEGGLKSLLAYLDGPSPPQEPAAAAVRNLVGCVATGDLLSMGLLPRLVHVLKAGSAGAQQASAATVCKICARIEMKKLAGEHGFLPPLIAMLAAKTSGARESAAQALCCLMICPHNAGEVKKDPHSVPNLVHLLDPSACNSAKKYAVGCLLVLSPSKRCKKLMISYGAIGYLKKLCDMDVPGSKKLLDRLQRGKLRNLLFSRG